MIEDYEKFREATGEEAERLDAKYVKEWTDIVNSVADEFDELARLKREDHEPGDDWDAITKREKELTKKAFSDLADIFGDLNW